MPGNFYTVECPDCGNEQQVFGKAASQASCAVCGTTLATPTGGDARFTGEVVGVVERRE